MLFSRKKSTEEAPAEPTSAPAGKGRPTPKRKDAEAARKRPLVPSDRKEAAKVSKEKNRELRAKSQEALMTGDERYMPIQHKGPAKRYTRDFVDARWSLGEFFLPIAVIVMALTFVLQGNAALATMAVLAVYLVLIAVIIDSVIMTRQLRKRLIAKFGEAGIPRGTMMYAFSRVIQMRNFRMPKPQVKRGQYPS